MGPNLCVTNDKLFIAPAQDEHRVCSRCVCDTTIPGITFDEQGVCKFCYIHDYMEASNPMGAEGERLLEQLAANIRRRGAGKDYDCVVGVSGGRDSMYSLLLAKRLGLNPLAVHFDNGWNSETAVNNIRNGTRALGVDLYTVVADWEEFKDLQVAFLKASVSDADIPTDVAIFGTLHQVAAKEGIGYIINGHSFRTEGIMPLGWTYMDGRYLRDVHRRFGRISRLRSIPNFGIWELGRYRLLKGIHVVTLLNHVSYRHKQVQPELEKEMGWTYYGGHHHESYYTNFFQSYYLPNKFGIDKRKVEYSALVRSGQMNREQALLEISQADYPYDPELIDYVIRKLELTKAEFENILAAPRKSFHDYNTYYPLMRSLSGLVKRACQMNLLPPLLYLKFLS